jgi:hypothetical protein
MTVGKPTSTGLKARASNMVGGKRELIQRTLPAWYKYISTMLRAPAAEMVTLVLRWSAPAVETLIELGAQYKYHVKHFLSSLVPLLLTNFLTPTSCKHISHLMHCNSPQIMRRKLQETDRIIHPRSADVFIPAAIDRPPSMSI